MVRRIMNVPTNEPRHGVVDHQRREVLDRAPCMSIIVGYDDAVHDYDSNEAQEAKGIHDKKAHQGNFAEENLLRG